jgi:hypothetical protein
MTKTIPLKSLDGFSWNQAIGLAKHGDPDNLATLLRDATKPVPENVRTFLADVVDGTTKPPGRNTRIKVSSETKLTIYKAAGGLAMSRAAGLAPKLYRQLKKTFIADLSETTGAKESVITKIWNEYEKPQLALWTAIAEDSRRIKEEVERDKRRFTTTIVRNGKKVKLES